jgi:hypothetical protein
MHVIQKLQQACMLVRPQEAEYSGPRIVSIILYLKDLSPKQISGERDDQPLATGREECWRYIDHRNTPVLVTAISQHISRADVFTKCHSCMEDCHL